MEYFTGTAAGSGAPEHMCVSKRQRGHHRHDDGGGGTSHAGGRLRRQLAVSSAALEALAVRLCGNHGDGVLAVGIQVAKHKGSCRGEGDGTEPKVVRPLSKKNALGSHGTSTSERPSCARMDLQVLLSYEK